MIERAGGKVLVRVSVDEILYNGHKVMGVLARKATGETFRIEAPAVVSSAGILNTFQNLLPKQVAQKSYFYDFWQGNCYTKKQLFIHMLSFVSVRS